MLCIADPLGVGFGPDCVPDDCGAAFDCAVVACCCQILPPGAAPQVTPRLATAAPTAVACSASSNTTTRMARCARRSLNDTSPRRPRNYRAGASHAYPSRYHRGSTRGKPCAENSHPTPIASLGPATLAENLHRHARASGNRDDLRAHDVRANTASHQIVSRSQRGAHVCGTRRHGVLRVQVVDRGLQLNVHRSWSGRETDLPTNRAPILGKTGIVRQRELLPRLPRSWGFMIESWSNVPGENRARRDLPIIVRHRRTSSEGSVCFIVRTARASSAELQIKTNGIRRLPSAFSAR
jgi:hypothetical protein